MFNNLIRVILFPLFLFGDVINSNRSILKKIGYFLLVLLIFGFIWISSIRSAAIFIRIGLFDLGVVDKVSKIKISGTSMLPTLKDGSEVELNSPKKYGLSRGDIVTFQNNETGASSYIKRIVGLPGEKITIKNGYYFINGKTLDENYTLNNLPTFGNTFLSDCIELEVPKNSYFVSGDNRTVSSDSRVIGFIDEKNIDGVIKTNVGEKFLTTEKQRVITQKNINSDTFLKLLNNKRVSDKKGKLATHALLNQIANDRAKQISDDYDNWKKNAVPLDKLLDSKGYRFNSIYEFVTFGYLSEQDIINQIIELQSEKDKFLGVNFSEVGIGISERTYKECKYPVISVILSWPSIPTYNQEDIDSWAEEIKITNQLLSNMQTWVGIPGKDQEKLRKIISNAAEENEIAKRIYAIESGRKWLTAKDYQDMERYNSSVKETEALIDDLFGPEVKGISTKRGIN